VTAYWATFTDASPVCVEAASEAVARVYAEKRGTVAEIKRLPYPASPRIGDMTQCPSFCYTPNTCAGRGSCPKDRACND